LRFNPSIFDKAKNKPTDIRGLVFQYRHLSVGSEALQAMPAQLPVLDKKTA